MAHQNLTERLWQMPGNRQAPRTYQQPGGHPPRLAPGPGGFSPGRSREENIRPRKYRPYTRRDIDRMPQLQHLDEHQRLALKVVSAVLPFRTNSYVIEDLIRWENVPEDPIYQLTFPQEDMLEPEDFEHIAALVRADAPADDIIEAARRIQFRLNPHPAGQKELNVPRLNGEPLPGMQHKYRETVLIFPSQGQTCHAYCTYCFRWAQFVGLQTLKFATREAEQFTQYLKAHREVTSVLFTGGDPMIMRTDILRRYIEPLLHPDMDHIASIRIGTKAPAYWPYRFITDTDSDDLLRLFEEVRHAGRHLALMGHYSHPRELETAPARTALRRILDAGAVVRCQAPLIRHVNDSPDLWTELWRQQVRLGAIPYYMFIERDTGARNYFEVPLAQAYEIFRTAYRRVSGLGRTVRGPSMSATPGKVVVDGIARIDGRKAFVLKFIQARNPDWVGRPFFAAFDPKATWLDQLRPATGAPDFFFEEEMRRMAATACSGS